MITDFKYGDNGRLLSFNYYSENNCWVVNVKSCFAVKATQNNDSNAGEVIENYRKKRRTNTQEAEIYFDSKTGVFKNFINSYIPTQDGSFDYVQIMYPSDERRRRILNSFSQKNYNSFNDFSEFFIKQNDVSTVGIDCEVAKDFFQYNKPEISTPINTLLIIDDTIDTGCTINIFLDNLIQNGVINTETIISATIIYNNFRNSLPKLTLEQLRNTII